MKLSPHTNNTVHYEVDTYVNWKIWLNVFLFAILLSDRNKNTHSFMAVEHCTMNVPEKMLVDESNEMLSDFNISHISETIGEDS